MPKWGLTMPKEEVDASRFSKQHFCPKRVRFSSELKTMEAPDYDRTACEPDMFSCDICGIQIAAGIKGFEPYGTCDVCVDGFDACGACCGTKALMRICHETKFSPTKNAVIRCNCHEHPLKVVDRKVEILWANNSNCGEELRNGKGAKRSPRHNSRSPRKQKLGKLV